PGFVVQLGPKVLSLSATSWTYPGWNAIKDELVWVLQCAAKTQIIGELERLGVRYINFFEEDVFQQISIGIHVAGAPLQSNEVHLSTVLEASPFQVKVDASSGVVVKRADGTHSVGSVLDLDAWLR